MQTKDLKAFQLWQYQTSTPQNLLSLAFLSVCLGRLRKKAPKAPNLANPLLLMRGTEFLKIDLVNSFGGWVGVQVRSGVYFKSGKYLLGGGSPSGLCSSFENKKAHKHNLLVGDPSGEGGVSLPGGQG